MIRGTFHHQLLCDLIYGISETTKVSFIDIRKIEPRHQKYSKETFY